MHLMVHIGAAGGSELGRATPARPAPAQAVSVESLGAIAIGQFAACSLCVCSGVKMLLGYSKQVFWL
jgi:hypothetical protein